ncbi:MAG: protein translocase subunit SecD [Candidatus Mcinerneyibacterium aminivorans]|uniref:Protein translocase subunit SecD n=1 Tax=Candidatus Mcinerneyibacterium aminivorans TaxID=2703815 RepID=A0A5D0MED7_9BACT|nr:MAG: protein translocase subunit SecD [Candidatus Mcinerneyibacterium aminivorans]
MKRVERWKWMVIIFIFLVMFFTALPSTGVIDNTKLKKWLPHKVNLGLDLQGGTHVVFIADVDQLKKKIEERGGEFKKQDLTDAMDRALKKIRNRVDKFGVAEPVIRRQGDNRIVVELAGIKNPSEVAEAVGKTAYLEFKLVAENQSNYVETIKDSEIPDRKIKKEYLDDNGNVKEDSLPKSLEIRYQNVEKEIDADGKLPYVLRNDIVVEGDSLKDAFVTTQKGQYVVSIKFNPEGARKFARVTGEYTGRQLAIVLDDVVQSAPRINQRIPNGSAIIEGDFSTTEARNLALVLKTGALPVPLETGYKRTVGASLGQDSVNKGMLSIAIGFILVVIFMVIYYKWSGVVADIALIFNLIIILGILVMFNATLTLPGIAGILLTIGMSVDVNVLIFERIREESRMGRSVSRAISNGFDRAFVTILDANVTTIITAIVLYNFGSGPIRGFAVTLMIGIAASMFTALFVSRVIYQTVLTHKNIQKLSI